MSLHSGAAVTDGPPAYPPLHGRAAPRRRSAWRPAVVSSVVWSGAAAVTLWPVYLMLTSPGPLLLAPLIAHVGGMLAGYGVVVMLALMSRAPALERGVGADVLTRWHGRGGRAVITLILLHAGAAVAGWAQARQLDPLAALIEVLGMPGLVMASVGTVLLCGVAVASVRMARSRVSYERWHGVHLLTYLGIALAFVHELAGPDLAGHRLVQVSWALLYVYVFALLLCYRVLAPLRQAVRHGLHVGAVVPEGSGVVSIVVEGSHLDELEAKPGQFFRWRFLTRDSWLSAHPFSLSAVPTNTQLRLTVKALGHGSRALQDVPLGTRVLAEGPYGAMTAARRTRRNVLLVAGGVGITPMRALFESIPVSRGQDLTLLYRARSVDDLIFRIELEAIADRRGVRLHYLVGADRTGLTATGMLRLVPDLAERDVYLCGPEPMSAAVRSAVRTAGLPAHRLHEERFAF